MDDRNAPATKGDIFDLDEKIDRLEQKFDKKFDDLIERISDSETRLLRAFYDFATSNQKRMTELEGNEAAIRSRMATIEDRLLQVEKRLNMPPQAA